jgi:hypothetical protein
MKGMIRKYLAVGGILSLAVALGACRSPDDVNKDLATTFEAEAAHYQRIMSLQGQSGDRNFNAYSAWIRSLESLASYAQEMVTMIQSAKPEQKKKYEGAILALREPLDVVLSRSDRIELLIPSWLIEQAMRSNPKIGVAMESLRSSYASLYGQSPNRSALEVVLTEDTALYDTYGDCVSRFAKRYDSNCQIGAAKYCTHQTNLVCVDRLISSRTVLGTLSCSDVIDNGAGQTDFVLAEWMNIGLSACQATEPIFK